MDEVARYNRARWKALAEADALFSRPCLDLDAESARRIIDADELLGDLSGKDVLCLAGGGGQQSAAFALLGANITVIDLSEEQLERDAQAAKHYGYDIKIIPGDMRNLSAVEENSFDIVHQAYSLNFVPNCQEVFRQVANVLRTGALYRVACANPFTMGTKPNDWNGSGYLLTGPYVQDAVITYDDLDWVYDRAAKGGIAKPIEYRHALSTLINGLIESGFSIKHVSDSSDMHPNLNVEPGSWDHFVAFAPPWLNFLARLEH
jgi:ubiquinone/menaquinone biosynthesis C-methylase UbiE